MTPQELAKELAAGSVRPAYLLAGEEALLRDDAIATLREHLLDGVADDFNFDRLPGDASSPGNLQDALAALPVMGARRLVLLVEPEGRRGGSKALVEAIAERVPELLGRAMEQEAVDTVFVVAAARPDKRARWIKCFGKEPAAIVACDPPRSSREVAAFVREEAKRQQVSLAGGVAERLAELVGPQLLLLRREIEKVSLLAGPGEKVAREHVEASTNQLVEEPVWDLTDAIGEGRAADALGLLTRLRGVPAPVLLGSLAAHFRKLSRVRHGGAVAGPPFVRKKLESQARRFSTARLGACLDAIHETDVAIKGASALPPELVVERLVLGLAS